MDFARFHHHYHQGQHGLLGFDDVHPEGVRISHTPILNSVLQLNRYFEYFMDITCGIPTVTLEGTKADWLRIIKRLERLHELGDEPSAWATMLYPILRRFVSAFDGKPDIEFWKHVVYRQQAYCGQDDLNGWLTAFCVWTSEGKWKAGPVYSWAAIPRPPRTVVASGPRPEFVKPTSSRGMRLAKIVSAPFKRRVRKSVDGASLDQHQEATASLEQPEGKAPETVEADGSTPVSQSVLRVGKCPRSLVRVGAER